MDWSAGRPTRCEPVRMQSAWRCSSLVGARMLREPERSRTASRGRAVRGSLVQREQAFYRTFSRARAFPHFGRRKRELHLAPVERSIGVSSRDVARPAMVGVRAAHRGAWAVRRFSLDRAFTAIAVLPTARHLRHPIIVLAVPELYRLGAGPGAAGWPLCRPGELSGPADRSGVRRKSRHYFRVHGYDGGGPDDAGP